MNFPLIASTVGYILWVEAGFMLVPLLFSAVTGDGCVTAFAIALVCCVAMGGLLRLVKVRQRGMQARDGYVAVALAWVALAIFGALPYLFAGAIPHVPDAIFETISGLTTTGATIFTAVEHLPRSILLWRSETQWMGGMGVLVLFLALMPRLGDGAVYLMNAESPGPIKSKLVPRVGGTAKILYAIYVGLTVAEVISLRIAGMPLFDAVNHAFTTMATGGFSVRNGSIADYHSAAIEWVVIVFTFLAGVNFSLLFVAVRGNIRSALRSEELRFYTGAVVLAAAVIGGVLWLRCGEPLSTAVRDALFQVTTIVSTTGYATRDFALWPTVCQCVLLALMYMGACAGSTAGGMKVSRILLLCKSLQRELKRLVHPNRVSVITMDGQTVGEQAVASAHAFQVAYLLIFIAGALVVSVDHVGVVESLSASLTCISNVGPGLGALGPMSNFSALGDASKWVLSLVMLMGRLELMPLLVLLNPSTWRSR